MVSCSLFTYNTVTAIVIFCIFLYQVQLQDFCDVDEYWSVPMSQWWLA